MPQAVTHILVPILLVSLVRDFILSKNKKAHFPLHYVLIAGFGGVLPDIDIPISIVLKFFGAENWWIHKTFTHSVFFPLIFLALFLVLKPFHERIKVCSSRGHVLKIHLIALMLAIGVLTHIGLDLLAGEYASVFYPLSVHEYGLNLFALTGLDWGLTAALIDGILLVVWISYLELRHKISDFI